MTSSVIILMVFIRFFFFGIFFFPIFYDDFLSLRPQIDRFTMTKGLIEFLDVVSCDILLPSCHQMSLDYIREGVNQDIEWFTIFLCCCMFVWLDGFLECMDHISWLTRIPQDERLIAQEFYYDIRYTEY